MELSVGSGRGLRCFERSRLLQRQLLCTASSQDIVQQLSIQEALDKLNENCDDETRINENTLLRGATMAIRRVSTVIAGSDYTLLRGLVDDDVTYSLYKNAQTLNDNNRQWLAGVEKSRINSIKVYPNYIAYNIETQKMVVPVLFVATHGDSWILRLQPSYIIHFFFEKSLKEPDEDFVVSFLFYFRPSSFTSDGGNIVLTSLDTNSIE